MMINKEKYLQELKKMVSEHRSDCEVYFTTITFKEMKISRDYDHYREFFRYFRQKLDNALLGNSKKHFKRPVIVMIPEDLPALHFHGFIFIHKDTNYKLFNKCVASVTQEYVEKLERDKFSIHLSEKITKPYPKSRYNQRLSTAVALEKKRSKRNQLQKKTIFTNQPMLCIHNIKMYPISNSDEIQRSVGYCMKKFSTRDDNLDRIIIEAKDKAFVEDEHFRYRRIMSTLETNEIQAIAVRYILQLSLLKSSCLSSGTVAILKHL